MGGWLFASLKRVSIAEFDVGRPRVGAEGPSVPLNPGGRPGSSHLLAVCPGPEPVPVRDSVERNELDIRTALKHPTDQSKVAARGPQTGPRGHVSVPTIEHQKGRNTQVHGERLRGSIEGVGQSPEALDGNFRRRAGSFEPAAHSPTVNLEQFGGISLPQTGRRQQNGKKINDPGGRGRAFPRSPTRRPALSSLGRS
jgi:hypothetical protein